MVERGVTSRCAAMPWTRDGSRQEKTKPDLSTEAPPNARDIGAGTMGTASLVGVVRVPHDSGAVLAIRYRQELRTHLDLNQVEA